MATNVDGIIKGLSAAQHTKVKACAAELPVHVSPPGVALRRRE
jgi:hypothetical protein